MDDIADSARNIVLLFRLCKIYIHLLLHLIRRVKIRTEKQLKAMFSQFSSGHTNPPVTCFYPSDTPDLLPRYRKYPFRNPLQSFSEYPQSFLHNCYISTILMYHYTVSPVFSQEFEKKNTPKLLFTGRHFWNRKCRKKTWWQQEFAVFKCEATANSVTGHVCVNSNPPKKRHPC